ncbi:MAG: hypothetical protein Q9M94_05180 [Candidatus Gracilibacteria bacterium]|nr:hypothetical protein [Candidatus Gracilibacteria bacterium]MDQ7021919.1 hypothetical protein [Candidatus Gracilibacteria bacterium]
MEFKKLLQHIQIPKRFIQNIGINPSILLKELIDKEQFILRSEKIKEGEFFFHEKKHIFINTALPRGKFDTARKKLEDFGLIEVKLGEGKKMFFKILNYKLNELFFPKADLEFAKTLFLEYILEDGYIFYPKTLAHQIGINETIFIKSLLSKRKYFEKQGKVINGYFFNSVSNVKADTCLSKDQQLKVIKNLTSLELIDVKLARDNTRYFCINDDKLIDYENIELKLLLKIGESEKSSDMESNNNSNLESKKIALFQNPFSKKESKKSSNLESDFIDNIESEKTDNKKVEKQIITKQNTIQSESEKADINKTKLIILDNKTKNNNIQTAKIIDNPLLLLLLKEFGLNEKNSIKLVQNYSEEKILENIKKINLNEKIINKAGFLIKSLEEEYNFINISEEQNKIKNKKLLEEKSKKNEIFAKEKIEKQKQDFYNNLLKSWILENREEYNKIFEQEKKKFLKTSSNLKNPDILIKAKVNAFIKSEILGV